MRRPERRAPCCGTDGAAAKEKIAVGAVLKFENEPAPPKE